MIKKNNYSIEERLKIFDMYKKGYTANEISKTMGRTKGAIQKEIQKFKKELKEKEELTRIAKIKNKERKDAVRALNHEVNSFISNRALIDKNRQHYKTNKKGDLILNKNDYTYTNDMPKCLKKEV
ncbi:helix-turn-helix domain-containing protein [Eubacterium multiforme]|uniref:IS30 family transposase n=1 Tax=Eubacterium multiforme TaxID=83339 RepID=A0ABT9UTF6_9FIRM|nr:helix-turn-helix domain-containing protein [Eubacterium multiforme]MDQ0149601.1 IS30 family transposase [Eubacterium multiforme]